MLVISNFEQTKIVLLLTMLMSLSDPGDHRSCYHQSESSVVHRTGSCTSGSMEIKPSREMTEQGKMSR